KHAKALAGALAGVVAAPRLGPLVARVPAMLGGAQREHALLGAGLLLVAPRAADRRVESMLVERLAQRRGLHHVGVQARSRIERVDPGAHPVLVDMRDQLAAKFRDAAVAEFDHLA